MTRILLFILCCSFVSGVAHGQAPEDPFSTEPMGSSTEPGGGSPLDEDLKALEALENEGMNAKENEAMGKTAATPPPAEVKAAPTAAPVVDLPPSPAEGLDPFSPEPAPTPVSKIVKPQPPTESYPEPVPAEPPPTSITEQEPTSLPVSNDPDSAYENRLSQIYKEFYSRPMSDEEWKKVVGDATEEYTMQKGDTLWSVSTTLFGNGFFWPKLWAMNSKFTNPHVVEVGDKIVFTPGSVSSEPEVELTRIRDETGQLINIGQADQSPDIDVRAEFPAPSVRSRRVLMKIPPSLPAWNIETKNYGRSGFLAPHIQKNIPKVFPISTEITESQPESLATVVEAETGEDSAGIFDTVLLRGSGLGPGTVVTAYATAPAPNQKAVIIDYQGEIKIEEDLGGGLFRGRVQNSLLPVLVGAKVKQGTIPTGDFSRDGNPSSVSGRVIPGRVEEERIFYNVNSICFLDVGQNKGLQEGSLLSVLKNTSIRRDPTLQKNATINIGRLRILKTTPNFSTALVLDAAAEIRPGDVVGSVSPTEAEDAADAGIEDPEFETLEEQDSLDM